MQAETPGVVPLRPAISWAVVVCLAAGMAPWLSGGQEPVALLISGFAMLVAAVLLMQQPAVRRLGGGPLVWSYVGLVGWGALSLVWSANKYSTVLWLIGLGLAGMAFRLAYAVCGDGAVRRRLVGAYVLTAAAVCAYGLWLYLTSGYDRLTSSFYWPNPMAAYLFVAGLVSFDQWRRGGRWWFGVLTVLFGTSFVLTGSRAAGLVLLFATLVYFAFIKVNKRFWIIIVFSGVVSFGAAYGLTALRHHAQPVAVISTPGSRLAPAASGAVQSGSDRIQYLKSAGRIWLDHPILGTGAGTFGDVHPHYQGRVVSASTTAHNVYAQTLAELGLVGAGLLLIIIAVLLAGMVRGLWHQAGDLAVLIGLGALLIHFGLDIDASYPALLVLIGALGGAMYYQHEVYRRLSWRVVASVAVLLVPVVALYLSDSWAGKAKIAQDDGDYEVAAANYAQAASLIFYNPDVVTGEAINRYTLAGVGEKGQLDQALGLARALRRIDPYDAQQAQLLGRVLEAKKDVPGAEAAYREALRLDPYNHPEYAANLAGLLAGEGRRDEAVEAARAMLVQYPPAVVANRAADPSVKQGLAQVEVVLGSVLLQRGELGAASEAAKRAVTFDPTSVRARALVNVVRQAESLPQVAPAP